MSRCLLRIAMWPQQGVLLIQQYGIIAQNAFFAWQDRGTSLKMMEKHHGVTNIIKGNQLYPKSIING